MGRASQATGRAALPLTRLRGGNCSQPASHSLSALSIVYTIPSGSQSSTSRRARRLSWKECILLRTIGWKTTSRSATYFWTRLWHWRQSRGTWNICALGPPGELKTLRKQLGQTSTDQHGGRENKRCWSGRCKTYASAAVFGQNRQEIRPPVWIATNDHKRQWNS